MEHWNQFPGKLWKSGCIIILCIITSSYPQLLSGQKKQTYDYSIMPSPAWTNLFLRSTGWNGADGIYSITLPKDYQNELTDSNEENTLLLFSDTVIDTLVNGRPSEKGFTMIHNSVALLNGSQPEASKIHFFWKKQTDGQPSSVFKPDAPLFNQKGRDDSIYYWLGDGLSLYDRHQKSPSAKDTTLAIFAYKMTNVSTAPFGFKNIGNELLLTAQDFSILKRVTLPTIKNGTFGAGIYQEKPQTPYIYIYGVRGMHKGLVIARTTISNLPHPKQWEFYTGNTWTRDLSRMKDITNHVSDELSLTRTPKGGYALIFQLDGIQPYIGMRLAPTPYGPFGPVDTIWHCTEPGPDNKLLVYNAKAHPALSPEGGLLISYNVNSLEFIKDLKEEPTFYRPRFLLLTWK